MHVPSLQYPMAHKNFTVIYASNNYLTIAQMPGIAAHEKPHLITIIYTHARVDVLPLNYAHYILVIRDN